MSFLQVPLREGYLYKIDTRLRPSGNQGALVTSAGGFARYHTGRGRRDAPVRGPALGAAGAPARALRGRRCGALRGGARGGARTRRSGLRPADRAQLAAEIRRMRERIEAEIGK